jgi:hypothetical protein
MSSERLGLTDLYNLFHDQKCSNSYIRNLRVLHQAMDKAVLIAYDWTDVEVKHDFYVVPYLPENDCIRYTVCDDARLEILRRLSRLNRERYEEERKQAESERQAQETHRPARKRRGKKPKLGVIQGGLF